LMAVSVGLMAVSVGILDSTDRPVLSAIVLAPFSAAIVFYFTSWIASRSRRGFEIGDFLRVCFWTLTAFGLGIWHNAATDYRYCWPQYADAARASGLALAGIGVFAVVCSLLIYPRSHPRQEGKCPICGYSSLHLTTGKCPECGHDYQCETRLSGDS
jgi:hypothetical protein